MYYIYIVSDINIVFIENCIYVIFYANHVRKGYSYSWPNLRLFFNERYIVDSINE